MEHALVVVVIGIASLEAAEKELQAMGVHGFTVTKVKGYGKYVDFLSRDHLVEQVKIEVFAPRERAELVANTLLKAAFHREDGDEIVAILPVVAVLTPRMLVPGDSTAPEPEAR